MLFCDSFLVTGHNSSNNSVQQIIGYFSGISAFDSTNIVLDGCQANSNNLVSFEPGEWFFTGIWAGPYFSIGPDTFNIEVRNCQANFNIIQDGGTTLGLLFAIYMVDLEQGIVDNCQANFNAMLAGGGDGVVGIIAESCKNIIISNSQACNNTGSPVGAEGIILFGSNAFLPFLPLESNAVVTNCIANSNGAYGLEVAADQGDPTQYRNITISNCVFNNNGTDGFPLFPGKDVNAAGILLETGPANVLIKGCQIYDTLNTNETLSAVAGIFASEGTNVVIEDTEVFNSATAPGFSAHGIWFEDMTDSKIIRSQVHGNQNSGIEVEGDNATLAFIECVAMDNNVGVNFAPGSTATCSLVQDSRALNNASAGFSYPGYMPLTVTFIGNEAQCNGPCACNGENDYAGLNDRISLQRLRLSNGQLKIINGNASLGARFTNLTVTP
jgi:hypothetical protein